MLRFFVSDNNSHQEHLHHDPVILRPKNLNKWVQNLGSDNMNSNIDQNTHSYLEPIGHLPLLYHCHVPLLLAAQGLER